MVDNPKYLSNVDTLYAGPQPFILWKGRPKTKVMFLYFEKSVVQS